jgi:hypothetical protein
LDLSEIPDRDLVAFEHYIIDCIANVRWPFRISMADQRVNHATSKPFEVHIAANAVSPAKY